VGDNAYLNSEHLLVPYPTPIANSPEDTFNFYLSQLRIRIEMSFARLVGKWGIFWKPLRVPLRNQPGLIKAVCSLHNYCIDEGCSGVVQGPENNETPLNAQTNRIGGLSHQNHWNTHLVHQRQFASSTLRNELRDFMEREGLSRPGSI
jgi:hypothetical protein